MIQIKNCEHFVVRFKGKEKGEATVTLGFCSPCSAWDPQHLGAFVGCHLVDKSFSVPVVTDVDVLRKALEEDTLAVIVWKDLMSSILLGVRCLLNETAGLTGRGVK